MHLLRRCATALPLVTLAACSDLDTPTAANISGVPDGPSLSVSASGLETFYGPERFTREAGKPQSFTRSIATAGFEGPFVVHVRSGDAAGSNRVSSARVSVDGEALLTPSDFSQQQESWSFARTLGATARLDVELASVPGSYLEVWVEGKRTGGVRFCPGDAGAHQTMEAALEAALEIGGASGSVLVCNGTHTIADVFIRRGVTVRSENPAGATLVAAAAGGAEVAFEVTGLPIGETVRFADLGFVAGKPGIIGFAVYTFSNDGRIEVDSSRFTSTGAARYVMVNGGGAASAEVVVQRSSFTGGAFGIWQQGPVVVRALNNRFDNSGNAIQFQGVAPGDPSAVTEVVGNTITNCGIGGTCLRVSRAGNTRIEDNVISNTVGRSVGLGIFVQRVGGVVDPGPMVVRNNRVLGSGLGSDRLLGSSYAFVGNGIDLVDLAAGASPNIVSGNTVTSAFTGIFARSGRFEATDNVVTNTRFGVGAQFPAPTNPLPLAGVSYQRNDIADAVQGYTGPALPGTGYVACNWWGSTYAPVMPQHIPGNTYAPWATAPIAGTSNPCDPTTMPALVKLCPTPDGATPMVRGMADGVKVTGAAGHLVVCNGTHPVGSVLLGARSITIRAENTLGATLDGALGFPTPQGSNFHVGNAGSGAVTLRGFRFVNATYNNVSVQGAYGSLLIEDSEFHPNQTMNYGDPLVGGPGSIGYRAGVGVYNATGGGVTARNNSFVGGDIGFNSANAGDLRVESNSFTNQNNAAVHIGGAPGSYAGSAEIVGNNVNGCSSYWCIGVFGASSVEITGNTLKTSTARRTGTAITVRAAQAVVNDNVIAGTSIGSDRSSQTSYDARFGISFYQTGNGTALRNRIDRTYGGIWVDQSAATATDNVIGTTWAPIGAWGPAGTSASLTANRNDFTDWVVALHGHYVMPAPNARCNWWGTAAGVSASQAPGFTPASYTPWATAPIAGGASSCTP